MARDLPTLIHELSDVDVAAVSIVGKGANRKRFFLRRSGDEPATELLRTGPAPHELVFKGDGDGGWSAVYCVVAEPGWLEDAGLYGDQKIADRWASEDEIRKAAHRFHKNGALVTKLHESLEPYGALVENAVALDTFTVDGPDGEPHTIRKGSWYVAIEPTAEGRAAIDAGEFTGVSIEGTGVRTLVEKAEQFTNPGTANVSAADRKKLAPLLRHYASKAHPFTACKKDQLAHGLSADHADRRCAVLKQLLRRHKPKVAKGGADAKADAPWSEEVAAALDRVGEAMQTADGDKVDAVAKGSDNLVRRALAKLLGDDPLAAELEDELAKARPTFAERMAQRDFEDELPDAFDVLRSAIWGAFYPDPSEDDPEAPATVIGQSLDEFKAWAMDLLESEGIAAVAKSVGQTGDSGTVDAMDDDDRAKLDGIATAIEELPAAIAKAIKGDDDAGEGADGGDGEDAVTLEDVAKSVGELTAKVEAQDAKLTALGAGGSSQPANGSGDGERVAKSTAKPHDGIL